MKLNKNFNPGAYPDRPDDRDFKYEEIVFGAPQIDWEKGYNVEKELGITLKVENQNGSSSCVGQAFSKYTEVLNYVETGRLVNHSPKSIYEQIYLPQGGAYLKDGAKIPVNSGVALEEWISSYPNGKPPTEEYMRQAMITPEIRQKMLIYQAKEYRSIGSANADLIAHAIMNNYGAVTGAKGDNEGWKDWIVKPPKSSNPWGHAFYLIGFGKDNTGKYFDFINSWGEKWGKNGRGRIYFEQYDIPNNAFGIWTLVDKPNYKEPSPQIMKLLNKYKNKILFNTQTGNFGLSVGDKLLVLNKPQRAGLMALMAMVRNSGIGITNEIWSQFPKKEF